VKLVFADKLLNYLIRKPQMGSDRHIVMNRVIKVIRRLKIEIIEGILDKYLSPKNFGHLYQQEYASFYFSIESLRKYMTKHLNNFYGKPKVKHYKALQKQNYLQRLI
jgi:hypothetical protein